MAAAGNQALPGTAETLGAVAFSPDSRRIAYAIEGRVHVQCYVTFTKRTARELGRVVDRWPNVAIAGLALVAATALFGMVQFVRLLL